MNTQYLHCAMSKLCRQDPIYVISQNTLYRYMLYKIEYYLKEQVTKQNNIITKITKFKQFKKKITH